MFPEDAPEDPGRIADEALEAARLDREVPKAVDRLRRRLLRQAVSHAKDALYNWVARGVEWYNANRGWVFLRHKDRAVLESIPAAAVRSSNRRVEIPLALDRATESFVARVFREQKGDKANTISLPEPGNGEPGGAGRRGSELAVPLFDHLGPEGGQAIGVLLLQADHAERFKPAQVRELRLNAAILSLHLLVLRDYYARRDCQPWVWHPEIHGWSPGDLMGRFCHVVAKRVGRKVKKRGQEGGPLPSCSVWNVDPTTGQCWALGTSGFDYEFLGQDRLGRGSAVARVASGPRRAMDRGAPKKLGFENLLKAECMGVREAAIVALNGRPDDHVHGTLNLYSLDRRTTLPRDQLLRWLARQAERFLATVNRQRVPFGMACIRCELGKSTSPNPPVRLFRKALMKVLPTDAMSIYVPETEDGKPGGRPGLRYIDGTGLENFSATHADPGKQTGGPENGPGEGLNRKWIPVQDRGQKQESITSHCYTHPGTVVRVNFGPDDPEIELAKIPKPNRDYFSASLMEVDADFVGRRRMGIGVRLPARDGTEEDALGVVRLYRTAKGRPFTEADREFVRAVCEDDPECCGRLFSDRATKVHSTVFSPPNILLPNTLRELARDLVEECARHLHDDGFPIREMNIFVPCSDAQGRYSRFGQAFRPLPPEEFSFEPTVSGGTRRRPEQIIVKPFRRPGRKAGTRIYVPLPYWDEAHLVPAVFALDSDRSLAAVKPPWDQWLLWQVFDAAVRAARFLPRNEWKPDPKILMGDLSEEDSQPAEGQFRLLEKAFRQYVSEMENIGGGVPELFSSRPAAVGRRRLLWCRDPELNTYKVRLTASGSHCLIPLLAGPVEVRWLLCELHENQAPKLEDAMRAFRRRRQTQRQRAEAPRGGQGPGEDEAWRKLRQTVALVTGAWARIVAPHESLTRKVRFKKQGDGESTVWTGAFRRPRPDPL